MENNEPSPPPGVGDRYIRTKITPRGEVTIEAFGFEGEQCLAATQDLEIHIGGQQSRDMKPPEAPGYQSTTL